MQNFKIKVVSQYDLFDYGIENLNQFTSQDNFFGLNTVTDFSYNSVNTLGVSAVPLLTAYTTTPSTEFCPNYSGSVFNNLNPVYTRPLQGGVRITYLEFGTQQGIPQSGLTTLGMVCVDNDTNSVVGLVNYGKVDSVHFCSNWNNPTSNPEFNQINPIGVLKKTSLFQRRPIYNQVWSSLITINQADFDSSLSWKPIGLTGITDYIQFASSSEINSLATLNLDLLSCTGRGQGIVKLKSLGPAEVRFTSLNQFGQGPEINFDDVFLFVASGVTTPPNYVCYPASWGPLFGESLIANFDGVYKYVGVTIGMLLIGDNSQFPITMGVASRMDKIATYLNISPYTGQTVNFSNINNIQYIYETDLTTGLTQTFSGNTYWQAGTYKQ